MKFISLLLSTLPLTGLASAAPADDIEVAASKRVSKLQKQYQENILDIIKRRTTGCTDKKILRRKEW